MEWVMAIGSNENAAKAFALAAFWLRGLDLNQ
jgi:hypothetical protein